MTPITDKIKQLPDGEKYFETPIKFDREGCHFFSADKVMIAMIRGAGHYGHDEEGYRKMDANALYIEKAVNEHARLVSELETAKRALENCLLTANKVLARRQHPTNNAEEWQHVRRFCGEAGVRDSILRDDIAQAALKSE